MLAESVRGARVLDLYAGSGAVGLEAVSRGAARAILVEEEAAVLERTLARLKPAAEEVLLLRLPAREAIEDLRRRGEHFDLILCDPPYSLPVRPEWGGRIIPLLAPGGLFVLQRDSRDSGRELEGLTLFHRRAYGRNVFYFYAATAGGCRVLEAG